VETALERFVALWPSGGSVRQVRCSAQPLTKSGNSTALSAKHCSLVRSSAIIHPSSPTAASVLSSIPECLQHCGLHFLGIPALSSLHYRYRPLAAITTPSSCVCVSPLNWICSKGSTVSHLFICFTYNELQVNAIDHVVDEVSDSTRK